MAERGQGMCPAVGLPSRIIYKDISMNVPAVWKAVTIYSEFLPMPLYKSCWFQGIFSSRPEFHPASTVNLELQYLLENKFIRINLFRWVGWWTRDWISYMWLFLFWPTFRISLELKKSISNMHPCRFTCMLYLWLLRPDISYESLAAF